MLTGQRKCMMKRIEENKIKYLLEYDNGQLMMLLGERVDTDRVWGPLYRSQRDKVKIFEI